MYTLSPLLVTIILEALARARKRSTKHPNKKEVKLFPFTDDTVLHRENPKEFTRKTRANKGIYQSFRAQEHQLCIYTIVINNLKRKLKKQFHLQ